MAEITLARKPIITAPIKWLRDMEKARQRREEFFRKFRQRYGVDKRTSRLIIKCQNPLFNHYDGQRYPPQGLLLASEHWKNRSRYIGDYFTILRHGPNPATHFEELKYDDPSATNYFSVDILKAIHELGIKKMTAVQRKAMQPIFEGRSVFVAAEMGSGKTLAYMAPIFDRLVRIRDSEGPSTAGAPRAVIVTPTWELAEQLTDFARRLGDKLNLGVVAVRGGGGEEFYAKEIDEAGRDILIGSVGSILHYVKLNALTFKNVRYLIIDEADTLLDETFCDKMYDIVKRVNFRDQSNLNFTNELENEGENQEKKRISAQLVLVSSTYPPTMGNLFSKIIDWSRVLHVTTDGIHRLQPHVVHRFLRTSDHLKPEIVLTYARKDFKENRTTAVFTREAKTAEWLENFLRASGVPAIGLRGTMPDNRRTDAYRRIANGETTIFVTTDMASLGLDTKFLCHVINYQMPHTLAGYLRRAGRIGRVNCAFGDGSVTNIVSESWEVSLVQAVEKWTRLGVPFTDVHTFVQDWKKQAEE